MSQNAQMLKGVLEGCILKLLENEAAYGYLIVERLKLAGFENIGEATVYPILTRLLKKGILSFEKRASDIGPPRKYYFLTEAGKAELNDFRANYKKLKEQVDNIFTEEVL